MSAFPFARDMKVCDSKGAIQTTLLVDNYIVSARLRVGLMPIAQGSWELLCIFFPAEFLTNWQHIAEMVPPFLRSPMPFVWAILQSTFVWDSSAACGKKITSHAWGPYPANPFAVLCALWPCALLSLLSWGRGGRWTRDEERRENGNGGGWNKNVALAHHWLPIAGWCWSCTPPSALSPHSCHSLMLVVLYWHWAGLAFWSHRRLTQQKSSG